MMANQALDQAHAAASFPYVPDLAPLIGARFTAAGAWLDELGGARKPRGSLVLETDTGIALYAREQLTMKPARAVATPRLSTCTIASASPLINGCTGGWAGIDMVLDQTPDWADSVHMLDRVILLNFWEGDLEPYGVSQSLAVPYDRCVPVVEPEPSTVREWDQIKDKARFVTSLVRVAGLWRGRPTIGVFDDVRGEVIYQDGDQVWVADVKDYPAFPAIALGDSGGASLWSMLVDPWSGRVVLECSSLKDPFWLLIAEPLADRLLLSHGSARPVGR